MALHRHRASQRALGLGSAVVFGGVVPFGQQHQERSPGVSAGTEREEEKLLKIAFFMS